MNDRSRAEDVLPNRGHWPRGAGLTVAVALAAVTVTTAPAAAAAAPPRSVAVTISGSATTIRTAVPGDTAEAWMRVRDGAVRMSVRGGYASARLASHRIVVGESVIELVRRNRPMVDRMQVTAKRETKVSAPLLTAMPEFTIVSGIVSHYDPRLGGYMGDSLSPVVIQESRGGTWITVRIVTTSLRGGFSAMTKLGAGRHTLRLVRPVGATVTGGTGIPASVYVPAR